MAVRMSPNSASLQETNASVNNQPGWCSGMIVWLLRKSGILLSYCSARLVGAGEEAGALAQSELGLQADNEFSFGSTHRIVAKNNMSTTFLLILLLLLTYLVTGYLRSSYYEDSIQTSLFHILNPSRLPWCLFLNNESTKSIDCSTGPLQLAAYGLKLWSINSSLPCSNIYWAEQESRLAMKLMKLGLMAGLMCSCMQKYGEVGCPYFFCLSTNSGYCSYTKSISADLRISILISCQATCRFFCRMQSVFLVQANASRFLILLSSALHLFLFFVTSRPSSSCSDSYSALILPLLYLVYRALSYLLALVICLLFRIEQ